MAGEYYKTKESVEEYIRLAEGHSGTDLIDQLKGFLAAGSTLLEIGSGPGTDWEILSKDYQVVGSDNSNEFIQRLQSKYPTGKFLELDASSLAVNEVFDGIYSNKVLHHLTDEELRASIERQHTILKPGGIICHSFWEGEGTEVFKGLFVNYQSEATIRQFLEPLFEILVMSPYPEFEDGDSLLVIGRKG